MAKQQPKINITGLSRRDQGMSTDFSGLTGEDNQFKDIPLEQISPNPDQPRKIFDEARLQELADSINQKGVLQPIIVMPDPDNHRYLLIAGERRYRAAKLANLSSIPALVKEKEDPLELGIIENLQREDLNPIEEATAIRRLKEERGYSDEQIAKILGTSRTNVNMTLSLNRLPEQIKEECQHVGSPSKTLLYEIVRRDNDEEMMQAWDRYKKGELSIVQSRKEQTKKIGKRPKPFEYKRKDKEKKFTVIVRFGRFQVEKDDIIAALERELDFLKRQDQPPA